MKQTILSLLMLAWLFGGCNSSKSIPKPHPTSIGSTVELTNKNFDHLVGDKKGVVVVYFWASWCGPCRMTTPVAEAVAKSHKGKAGIGKVDVDKNPELANKFNIRSIPSFIYLKNGEVVGKHVGVLTQQKMEAEIGQFLKG